MRFSTTTLGCKVNQYETLAIERILKKHGHEIVKLGEGNDICILNTCAVTAEGVRKSRQLIRKIKKLEPDALIAVCGCYSELAPEEAVALGADVVGGVYNRQKFALTVGKTGDGSLSYSRSKGTVLLLHRCPSTREVTANNEAEEPSPCFRQRTAPSPPSHTFEELPPGSTAGRTRALLKIQDGCDNFCTYCIVPHIRGRSRSLPLERVAEYAKQLKEQGYKEIVITGIEISSYGKDGLGKTGGGKTGDGGKTGNGLCKTGDGSLSYSSGRVRQRTVPCLTQTVPCLTAVPCLAPPCLTQTVPPLSPLIAAIHTISAAAPGIRLRLGSLDPSILTDRFCQKLSEIPNLCNHFHISLQSGFDDTLRRMGRKYSTEQALDSMKMIRKYFKDCGITADLITGFPGETESDFEQTLEFIKKAAFSDMHIFPYSQRPETKAAKMSEQIEQSVKKERARKATEIATVLAYDFKSTQIGKTVEVLFEQYKNGFSTGHASNYLEIAVKGEEERNSIRKVEIISLENNRLIGNSIDE